MKRGNPRQLLNVESWNGWKNTNAFLIRAICGKKENSQSFESVKHSDALVPDFQLSTFGLNSSRIAREAFTKFHT